MQDLQSSYMRQAAAAMDLHLKPKAASHRRSRHSKQQRASLLHDPASLMAQCMPATAGAHTWQWAAPVAAVPVSAAASVAGTPDEAGGNVAAVLVTASQL